MSPKPFRARYDGWCRECNSKIYEDDMIVMTDDGAVHEDCAWPEDDDTTVTFPI